MTARTVSVIGTGRIGAAVIQHVRDAPGLRLGRVLTRSGRPDTDDIGAFLETPADLVIDAAGPGALRDHGLRCLARAEVWSIGAAALVDPSLLARIEEAARSSGNCLRLFAPWAFGIDTAPRACIRSLELTVSGPGLAPWRGPLRDAARLFPDEVNFAIAAALNGPGIDRTRVAFVPPPHPGIHRLQTLCETEAGTISASMDFARQGRHPTALSLIAALERLSSPIT